MYTLLFYGVVPSFSHVTIFAFNFYLEIKESNLFYSDLSRKAIQRCSSFISWPFQRPITTLSCTCSVANNALFQCKCNRLNQLPLQFHKFVNHKTLRRDLIKQVFSPLIPMYLHRESCNIQLTAIATSPATIGRRAKRLKA